MPYAVYILLCADGTYYTGLTRDLESRLIEHQNGVHPKAYTFTRRPVRLLWNTEVEDYSEAFLWEHKIKGWTHRKKEALIHGGLDAVHALMRAEQKKRSR